MKNNTLTTLFMMKFLILLGLSSPLKAGDDMPAMEKAVASKGENITVFVKGPYSQGCKNIIIKRLTEGYPDIVEKVEVELNSEKNDEVRKTKVSKILITTKAGLTDEQIQAPFKNLPLSFQKIEHKSVE